MEDIELESTIEKCKNSNCVRRLKDRKEIECGLCFPCQAAKTGAKSTMSSEQNNECVTGKCSECEQVLCDPEEKEYNLCWGCMANNSNLVGVCEKNPNIGEIRDEEMKDSKQEITVTNTDNSEPQIVSNYSFIVNDMNGSRTELFKKKVDKSKKVKKNAVSPEGDQPTVKENNEEPKTTGQGRGGKTTTVSPGQEQNNQGNQKKPVAGGNNKQKGGGKKGQDTPQLVKESREVITKIERAKLRSFALINQAMKDTGIFQVMAIAEGRRYTVSSNPIEEGNKEDIIMATSMEVLRDQKNKKG